MSSPGDCAWCHVEEERPGERPGGVCAEHLAELLEEVAELRAAAREARARERAANEAWRRALELDRARRTTDRLAGDGCR